MRRREMATRIDKHETDRRSDNEPGILSLYVIPGLVCLAIGVGYLLGAW